MIEQLYQKYVTCNYNVCTDTRNITKNSLFFALKGASFDGNKFAKEAIEKGAKYAVIDNAAYSIEGKTILVKDVLSSLQLLANYHRKQFDIPFIGITGSNGKTTSKELIGCVLETSFKTLITKGNLNNHIGVPLTLLCLRKEHEIAIIEMGANHPLEIKELSTIAAPNYGIITNIGMAHIEGFGSFEGVKKTKKELYDYIQENGGTIFYNNDDSILSSIVPGNATLISYGQKGSSISGTITDSSPFISFSWTTQSYQSNAISSHLIGEYNFYNFLLAICIGKFFKIEAEKINKALSNYQPTNNRSQVKKTKNNTVIMDCYNANPTSVLAALESFKGVNKENKIAILGDMLELGNISQNEHQKVCDFLKENNIDAITVGEEFNKAKHLYKNFKSVDLLIDYLINKPFTSCFILLKGSRGIQLEKLIETNTL